MSEGYREKQRYFVDVEVDSISSRRICLRDETSILG